MTGVSLASVSSQSFLIYNFSFYKSIAWSQATIDSDNKRSSAATAYLGPSYISRPNLHVLIGATASRLVQTGTVNDLPSFHQVEFQTEAGSDPISVTAEREIVLSGGSIGTPMLLMLSGIGDEDELEDLGIDVVVNNPSVGKNLTDHPLLASVYSVNGDDSFDKVFRGDNLQQALGQWTQNGTGPLADGVCNHLAFLRLPSNSSIFEDMDDPAAGPNAAHIEFIVSVGPIEELSKYSLISYVHRTYGYNLVFQHQRQAVS